METESCVNFNVLRVKRKTEIRIYSAAEDLTTNICSNEIELIFLSVLTWIRGRRKSFLRYEKRRFEKNIFHNPKLEIEIISSNDMPSEKHSLSTYDEDGVVQLMETTKTSSELVISVIDIWLLENNQFWQFSFKPIDERKKKSTSRCQTCLRARNDWEILS